MKSHQGFESDAVYIDLIAQSPNPEDRKHLRQLATTNRRAGRPLPVDIAPDLSKAMPIPGLRMLRDTPYLRNLAFLVLLGTTGAARFNPQ